MSDIKDSNDTKLKKLNNIPDKDTPCLSVFSPNALKYGPQELRITDTFNAVQY